MSEKNKRPKREFRPQSHAVIYLIALFYVCYLLYRIVSRAVAGGADAPTALELILGIVILGGGAVLLVIMAWRMCHIEPPSGEEEQKALPQEEPEEAWEEAEDEAWEETEETEEEQEAESSGAERD